MKNHKNRALPYGNTLLKLASLLAVLLLFGLFFLLLRHINNTNQWARGVNHAIHVRKEISQTLVKLKDAEARQRGYLLTNDPSFLDHSVTRQQELQAHLEGLRTIVSDDPGQRLQVDSLNLLLSKHLRLLDEAMALHRNNTPGHKDLRANVMEGKILSEGIESRLQEMDSLQAQLLEQRSLTSDQFVAATPWLAGLLVLSALLIILFAFYRQRLLLRVSKDYLKKSNEAVEEVRKTSLLLEHAEQINNAGSWEWNYATHTLVLSANMHRLLHGNDSKNAPPIPDLISWLDETDRSEFLRVINQCIEGSNQEFATRFWITRTSGERKHFQCNGRIGKNADSQIIITGTARDITEGALLKQQLQQRKELIESIVENTSDLIAVVDKDMRYTVWNQANELQFGLKKSEVIGKRITDVFPFIKQDQRKNYIKEGLLGKAVYLKELPYLDGQKIAEFSYVPLTDASENVVGLLIIAHDITERKRAAENLQKTNAELKQKNEELEKANAFNHLVTSLAPSNIVVFDAIAQKPVFLNKQARTMFGNLPAGALEGNLLQEIVHPDDLPGELESIKNLQDAGDTDVLESDCRLKNENGEYRHMHIWRAVFKRNKSGAVEHYISVSLDVSDLRKAETELKERNRELLQANEELSSFNYIASHDLQEPLRKVQVFANLLQEMETSLSPQGTVHLNKIQMAAGRMRSLISDLLSYSQMSLREEALAAVDLNQVLAAALASLKTDADENKAQVITSRLPVVRGVRFQWQQLFENILSNAMKYTRPGVPPVIHITAAKALPEGEGEYALETGRTYFHLRFADNGIGFNPEYGEKIFEMFERLHNMHDYPGTGLGLAICKKVVQNHKGLIRATGKPGEGAVIDVYVPAMNDVQATESSNRVGAAIS